MTDAMGVSPGMQVTWLFLLALPIACIAWTVTHEDLFREFHDYCAERSERARRWYARKFFYVFTCEYCFSHYVTLGILALTGYKLLLDDWRGYVIGGFALVWIANIYMSVFARLRLVIKSERVDIKLKEEELQKEGEPQKD